jgi:hypothetical protein
MVYIKDEGSTFDAPIDLVFKFLQTVHVHKAHRHEETKRLNKNSFLLMMEENMDGEWANVVWRITDFPPLGMAVEMIEGPMAGSAFLNYYTPKGDKTEVTVVGEYVSKTIPAAQLEGVVRDFFEMLHREDSIALKGWLSRRATQ